MEDNMAHWLNDTDEVKPTYSGKNLSHCHLEQKEMDTIRKACEGVD
jgi:hypothetical protein